jgi:S1-C subfamily serine protease
MVHGHTRAGLAGALIAALVTSCSVVGPASLQTQIERTIHDVLPAEIVQIDTNSSIGSGVVYDTKGDIVTNAHVIAGARTISVRRDATSPPLPASVVGVSAANDLAVIRVRTGASTLHPANFGNSDDVKIGEYVLAMGDPLGLTDSVTQGIVSSSYRRVKEQHSGAVLTVIQTSAEINPGNSGGGLVNLSGKVIGMPTLNVSDPQQGGRAPGVGFAIPSNTVKRVAEQLVAHARMR